MSGLGAAAKRNGAIWCARIFATHWGRFALGIAAGAVVWAVWPRRPPIVVIDVDRGIADCPWFLTPPDPNGAPSHSFDPRDLQTEAVRRDLLLVLRNSARVVFAERVAEVRCTRPPEGPRIVAKLLNPPRIVSLPGDEPPKELAQKLAQEHAIAEPRIKAYRAVRGLFRQFDTQLCATAPLHDLDEWFVHEGANESARAAIALGRIGSASRASVRIDGGANPALTLDVSFAHTPHAPIHTCLPIGSDSKGSVLPICPEGDPAGWKPTSPRRCPDVALPPKPL